MAIEDNAVEKLKKDWELAKKSDNQEALKAIQDALLGIDPQKLASKQEGPEGTDPIDTPVEIAFHKKSDSPKDVPDESMQEEEHNPRPK